MFKRFAPLLLLFGVVSAASAEEAVSPLRANFRRAALDFSSTSVKTPAIIKIRQTLSSAPTAKQSSRACLILCWNMSSPIISGTTASLWNTAKPKSVLRSAKYDQRECR